MNVVEQSRAYLVVCTIWEELSNLEDLSELQMSHSKCLILESIITLEEGPKGKKKNNSKQKGYLVMMLYLPDYVTLSDGLPLQIPNYSITDNQ